MRDLVPLGEEIATLGALVLAIVALVMVRAERPRQRWLGGYPAALSAGWIIESMLAGTERAGAAALWGAVILFISARGVEGEGVLPPCRVVRRRFRARLRRARARNRELV